MTLSESMLIEENTADLNGNESPTAYPWIRQRHTANVQSFSQSIRLPEVRLPAKRRQLDGPTLTILAICRRWQFSDSEVATIMGFSDEHIVSSMHRGLANLSNRDAEDRIANIFSIYEGIHSLLRSEAQELVWLSEPVEAFNNKSPREIMLRGGLEDLIVVRDWVEYISGR